MKKYINLSFIYAVAAMIGGVFYREFTKLTGFTGKTTLSVVHTHLFLLGMIFFLLVLLLENSFSISKQKLAKPFLVFYNLGLCLTVIMLIIRGVAQVLQTPLSGGANGAISGFAGIGHIMIGIGMILLLLMVRNALPTAKPQA